MRGEGEVQDNGRGGRQSLVAAVIKRGDGCGASDMDAVPAINKRDLPSE